MQITEGLFWINRLVDGLFVVDMVCQFFLVPPEIGQAGLKPDSDLRTLIAQNYLRGWFIIDFLSIFPWDYVTYVAEQQAGSSSDTKVIRLLRIVRLARLAKILRVMRASRIIARYDDRVGISFVKFRIVKYTCTVLISSHWCACLLRMVPLLEGRENDNWILRYFGTNDVAPIRVYNAGASLMYPASVPPGI